MRQPARGPARPHAGPCGRPDHPCANFDATAEIYDHNMQKFGDVQGEINEILDFLALRPDQSILEIGKGTRESALAAARCCARVYALNLSPGMLRYAEKKAGARRVAMSNFCRAAFSPTGTR
jgi:putative AdoMet-dependent methyltransferase